MTLFVYQMTSLFLCEGLGALRLCVAQLPPAGSLRRAKRYSVAIEIDGRYAPAIAAQGVVWKFP